MAEEHKRVAEDLECTAAEAELWSVIGDLLGEDAPGRFPEAVAAYVAERRAGEASVESLARLAGYLRSHPPGSR